MNRAHLITCQSIDDYTTFINDGYAGLYPIQVEPAEIANERKLAAKIGTNWDIIADLKRVKINDLIYLHVRGDNIYGPFMATTYFLESPLMPHQFKSLNLRISYWNNSYDKPTFLEPYPWKVAIKSIDKVTNGTGFNSMELFKLKTVGSIHSIPERFFYHDKPKIVKPLLSHESEIISDILGRVSSGPYLSVSANSLNGYLPITLDLNSYNGEVYREKILEAWLMENVTFNGNNHSEYSNITSIFGNITHFANSIYTYYTNFMDILFYNESTPIVNEYCNECHKYSSRNKKDIAVIELKKGTVDTTAIQQLREYGDWTLKALANNNADNMKLYAIGVGFEENLISIKDVKLIRYTIHSKQPFLRLEQIN
jgi:hypothetical protein